MRKTIISSLALIMVCIICTSESGCDNKTSQQTQQYEKKMNNVESLMSKQPNPTIPFSMDRYLLAERLVRFNDPNKMSYLYIVLLDGTWLKVTIVGKLASTSKRLSSPEQHNNDNTEYWTTQAPDEMGTYGTSEPAKVGMTTILSIRKSQKESSQ